MRILLALMVTLSLAGLTAVGWLLVHPAPVAVTRQAAAPVPVSVSVIVASRVVHAGELMRLDDLAVASFPTQAVPPNALRDTAANRAGLSGALLRVTIPSGGLVLSQDLVRPGDHGYLAAVLTPGARAVSIGVDAVAGVAGLVWPGDYVDLIMTQIIDDPGTPAGHRMAAETVLTGLRVIATDQSLVRGEAPASTTEPTRTITLEATPEQAERISIASRLGHLSLSVCSIASCAGTHPAISLTWGSDISPALAQGSSGDGSILHLFNGAAEQKDFHF